MSLLEILNEYKLNGVSSESSFMNDFFDKHIAPIIENVPSIIIEGKEYTEIVKWAIQEWTPAVAAKYPKDSRSAMQRGMSFGFSETAIEKFWNLPIGSIFDRTIGNTESFDEADLSKIGIKNVGIKSSEFGLVPLISKFRNYHYQIFCVHKVNRLNEYCDTRICGYTSHDVILPHLSSELTADSRCKKFGFFGFDKLEKLCPLDEFRIKTKSAWADQ